MEPITIVSLSRQAGRILSHLDWLPDEVIKTIERYPYHTARCFAEGMYNYLYNKCGDIKNCSYPSALFFNNHWRHTSLCINQFIAIVLYKIIVLLYQLGEHAEYYFKTLNKTQLKGSYNLSDKTIYGYLEDYHSNIYDKQKEKIHDDYDNIERCIYSYQYAIDLAEDTGAQNLDGMKECWLVMKEYRRAFIKDNQEVLVKDNHISQKLLNLIINTEETPYPIDLYLQIGDELIINKAGGMFEKGWPNVVRRNGKYTIIADAIGKQDLPYIVRTSKMASDLQDIRMPLCFSQGSGHYVIAKKEGKWGAIYNGPLDFLKVFVPFNYESLQDVINIVQDLLKVKCDYATWDEFHGVEHGPTIDWY